MGTRVGGSPRGVVDASSAGGNGVGATPAVPPRLGLLTSVRKAAVRLAPERAFIAASDVGVRLSLLPGSGSAESIWFAVVQEAEKLGVLDRLVAWLQHDYPADAELARIQGALAAGTDLAPTDGAAPAAALSGLTAAAARRVIMAGSIGLCAAALLFFITAPALSDTLSSDETPRFLQLIVPTFAGYLSSATIYFVGGRETSSDLRYPTALVVAPLVLVALSLGATLFVFYWTNRLGARAGGGMRRTDLALYLTVAMALLSVTTTVLSNHLFARERGGR